MIKKTTTETSQFEDKKEVQEKSENVHRVLMKQSCTRNEASPMRAMEHISCSRNLSTKLTEIRQKKADMLSQYKTYHASSKHIPIKLNNKKDSRKQKENLENSKPNAGEMLLQRLGTSLTKDS